MPIEIEAPEEYGYSKIKYNLSESSCTDRTLSDLGLAIPSDMLLLYTEHRGSSKLRSLIVEEYDQITQDDVLVTSGASGALFIISTSLLGAQDHLVVIRPNYATNIETPRAISCEITFVELEFSKKFHISVEAIKSAIKDNTRVISVTCPHNPTGTMMSEGDIKSLVKLAKDSGCVLLVDETYSDIYYDHTLPMAASLGSHVVSVSSVSKSFGIPGARIGWLVCTDKALYGTFLAAKEQMSISGSVIDEWIAEQVLSKRKAALTVIRREMAARLDKVAAWMETEDMLEWVKPQGGVVCFPHMKEEPVGGTAAFYERLLNKYGTYVGPGHWFEQPDSFFRLGYGWPSNEELEAGLRAVSLALRG